MLACTLSGFIGAALIAWVAWRRRKGTEAEETSPDLEAVTT